MKRKNIAHREALLYTSPDILTSGFESKFHACDDKPPLWRGWRYSSMGAGIIPIPRHFESVEEVLLIHGR